MPHPKQAFGYFLIFLSTIGFGSYGIFSKLIGADFGIFYQGWVRSAMVLLVLVPLAYFTKNLRKVDKKDIKWILAPVLFGVATQAPLYYAYNKMDIGTTILIFYSVYVITSYVIGKVALGEAITLVKYVSLFLAFVGLLLIFGFSLAKFSLLAMLLAGVNGIASGGEVSTTKKTTQKYSSMQIVIYVWLGILVTHLPLSLLVGERQVPFAWSTEWFAMIGFAFAGLAAFSLVIEGFKYVDASIGGLVGLLEIPFGVIFGFLFFHETITPLVILGGLCIVTAAMLPDVSDLLSRKRGKNTLNG